MEQQKILNLLNEACDFNFVTRKWNIVDDNLKSNYNETNEITCNREVLESNFYDYNDAYILLRDNITAIAAPQTRVVFENCAQFTKSITKSDETRIDDAENLDLVMPMYNLTEYSSNYSEKAENLWFYSNDETSNFDADIVNDNNFKSFKYKTKLLGDTAAQPAPNDANGILKMQ